MSKGLKKAFTLANVILMTGLLLIAAALFCVYRNYMEDESAGKASEETMYRIIAQVNAQKSALDTEGQDALPDGEIEIPDYLLNPDLEMPVQEIDGRDYLGTLSIPSLELELPVAANLSLQALKIAPCYYTGSVYKDNMVIAAHNYRRHFGRIGTLKKGESVVFTDVEGNEFHYLVEKVEQLEPYEVDRMINSEYALTLFTCTLGGKHRVTLRCVKAEDNPVSTVAFG
jgi:sortase A